MSLPRFKKDSSESGIFEKFPKIFKKKGRVGAFEDLRDVLLSNWETMMNKGMNAYSVIKLVIETDRHAMFAEVQQDKKRQQFDQNVWSEFQDYLHGGVPGDEQVTSNAMTDDETMPVDKTTLDSLTAEHGASLQDDDDYDTEDDNSQRGDTHGEK